MNAIALVLACLLSQTSQPAPIDAVGRMIVITQPGVYEVKQVLCSPDDGIVVRSAGVTLRGGLVAANSRSGVKSYYGDTIIVGQWNRRNGMSGILFGVPCTSAVIQKCRIEENGTVPAQDHGVYASGHVTVIDSIIDHNIGYGLHLYPDLNAGLIMNNVAWGNRCADIMVCSHTANNVGSMVLANKVDTIEVRGVKTIVPHRIIGNNVLTTQIAQDDGGQAWAVWAANSSTPWTKPKPATRPGE